MPGKLNRAIIRLTGSCGSLCATTPAASTSVLYPVAGGDRQQYRREYRPVYRLVERSADLFVRGRNGVTCCRDHRWSSSLQAFTETKMRALIVACAGHLAFMATVEAAPRAPALGSTEPPVELVDHACGWGLHRVHWQDHRGYWHWHCVSHEHGYHGHGTRLEHPYSNWREPTGGFGNP